MTASDLGSSVFLTRVTQPGTSENGDHFFGGMPMVGDTIFVAPINQFRGEKGVSKTQYRFIGMAVDRRSPDNILKGRNRKLRAGEHYVRSSGRAESLWDSAGNVSMVSGFRSGSEIDYRRKVIDENLEFDHEIPFSRDHLTIWADIEAGNNTPLRTLQSEVSGALVQWGLANRIQGFGERRVFNRSIGEGAFDEFRAVIQDDDRRQDLASVFIGPGFDSSGVEIKTQNTNGLSVGGFVFNRQEEDPLPFRSGLLFDEFGRFDLTDAHGNAVFSDRSGLQLNSVSTLGINSSDSIDLNVSGLYGLRAKTGNLTYGNLSRAVGGDSYAENIAAEHLVVRSDRYEDAMTSLSENTPSYVWKIDPSPVGQIRIGLDDIELGNDASQSNVLLENQTATIGKSTMVGQFISNPTELNIGGDSAQVPMSMTPSEVNFGTGTVDVSLALARNTIEHAVANVIDAAQNFFGTDYLDVSQPVLRGTSTTAFLTTLIANIIAIGTASSAVATALGTHIHPSAGVPSPDGAIIGGIAASTIGTAVGGLTTQSAQAVVPGNLISIKNFTG